MSLWGTTAPRFIYHDNVTGEATVELDNARVLDVEPVTDYIELVSQIDGTSEMEGRGTAWTVRILVHLFKYADPAAAYAAIVSCRGHFGTLWLHRDGNQFPDAQTTFTLKDVAPFHLTTTTFKDAAVLTFETATEFIRAAARSWINWGQTDVTPLGDTSYTFDELT